MEITRASVDDVHIVDEGKDVTGEKYWPGKESVNLAACISDVWSGKKDRRRVLEKLNSVVPPMNSTELLLGGPRRLAVSDTSLKALQQSIRRRRIDVTHGAVLSASCIVFTAPHTLELLRDGHSLHMRESYTGSLTRKFATACEGASVTWTERERARCPGYGCPSNRDPNYLRDAELAESVWFAALRSLRELMSPALPAYLVDIHGMRDPPAYPVDCLVGTNALRCHHGDERADRVCLQVEEVLRPLVRTIPLDSVQGPPFMDLEVGGPETKAPKLGGAWPGDRNTLTQMSMNRELFLATQSVCFTHAIQVELSLRLRKYLHDNAGCRAAFAAALAASLR